MMDETMMPCASRGSRLHVPVAVSIALLASNVAAAQQAAPAADAAHSQTLDIEMNGGISYSDNIHRSTVDEQSGTIGRVGTAIDYQQHSRRLEAAVDLNAAYEDYSDDAFESGVVGGVDASLDMGIVPERFTWSFQENFGQITTDPFAATTPENREDINYFTTGPDFFLHFGDALGLRVGARYSDVQYEVSPTDGTQLAGSLSLVRQMSGKSSLSLTVDGSRFEFDDQLANTDYDRYQAFLTYHLSGARTDLSVDAGYSRLNIGDDENGGSLARISASRQLSPGSTLSLSVGTQFSDSGDLFRQGQDFSGVNLQTSQIVATGDPFESRFASVGYDFERNRTSLSFSAEYEQERYETLTDLDRTLVTWNLRARRHLSAVFSVSLFAELIKEEFDQTDYSDDELRAGAFLDWTVGRRLAVRFQFDHFDRDSSLADTEYSENRGSVFLIYSPTM
jgi:hypothetical protein